MSNEQQGALQVGRAIFRKHGIAGFIGAGFDYLTRPLLMPFAIQALRRQADASRSVEDLVSLIMGFHFANVNIAPMQIRSEIVQLCMLVKELRPKTVLEIGTAKGGTLCLFTRLADPEARILSVDLPLGQFGGGYPAFKIPLYRSFATRRQHIELVRADSHSPHTLERVTQYFAGRAVDFLFIDGDHSYEGVSSDFSVFSRLVRPGGLIAFHDIVPGQSTGVGEVPRFWQDLKAGSSVDAEFIEFVASWMQDGLGIGVLRNFNGRRAEV